MIKILLAGVLLILSACYAVETSTVYDRNLTNAVSTSKPVHLSFYDNKDASFYFVLSRDTRFANYFLHLRWHSAKRKNLFLPDRRSSLKLLIDQTYIMTFYPASKPRIISYNLDSKEHT